MRPVLCVGDQKWDHNHTGALRAHEPGLGFQGHAAGLDVFLKFR